MSEKLLSRDFLSLFAVRCSPSSGLSPEYRLCNRGLPGLFHRLADAEIVHVSQAHLLAVNVDGRKNQIAFLQPRKHIGMLLANARAGQVVVVHLDRVAIFSRQIPGNDLRNLFLRLRGPSTTVAVLYTGGVVKNVDDVPHRAVEIHSIHLVRIVAALIKRS